MADALRERLAAGLGARYRIEWEIGRGGMGVVYRAVDERLRRPVAIKVLPPELAYREETRRRFLREAQTAAQLSHPSIVPIYEVDEREGLVYFVMALVEGESLARRLSHDPRPSLDVVTRVLHDVADALAAAHARGIIHRDIKPDNILLDRHTGRPLVTDFGIARAAEGDSRLTLTGITVGTPAYMSPEQASGAADLDGRSDLYSLGVVGYQMLAGELPFTATNTPAMLMKHLNEPPPPLRGARGDLPEPLVRTIERALAKRPDDRFPDAASFRDALASAPPANGPHARPAPASPAVPRPEPAPAGLWRAEQGAAPRGREATDAARAPWRTPVPPAVPSIPPWMPASWRDARRQWKAQMRAERGRGRDALRQAHHGQAPGDGGVSVEQRIRAFRRSTAGTAVSIAMLATINAITSPFFPWFIFPSAFMTLAWVRRAGDLWADGISLRDIFGKHARLAPPPAAQPSLAAPPDVDALAATLAPRDVLAGAHGAVVRRAAEDRAAAQEVVGKLSKADRELIPDVLPSIDALAERIGALAQALHRIDADVRPEALAELEVRIAAVEQEEGGAHDRERRLSLLQRQRSTLRDLLERRTSLASQLESASLMLQTMKLDLLALRSAGVQSALDDMSSATQEARALSRDIEHVLDAAREIRER